MVSCRSSAVGGFRIRVRCCAGSHGGSARRVDPQRGRQPFLLTLIFSINFDRLTGSAIGVITCLLLVKFSGRMDEQLLKAKRNPKAGNTCLTITIFLYRMISWGLLLLTPESPGLPAAVKLIQANRYLPEGRRAKIRPCALKSAQIRNEFPYV